jgi:hypothetical protein
MAPGLGGASTGSSPSRADQSFEDLGEARETCGAD